MDLLMPAEAGRTADPWPEPGPPTGPPPGRPVAPADEAAEAGRRADEWNGSLRPFNAFDLWLVGRIAVESVRLERLDDHERALAHESMLRAGESWDADRALEAAELGATLGRDPARVAARLRQTEQGADWLVARLVALEAKVRRKGAPDDADRARALDLLGVPRDERDEADPAAADPDALRGRIAELEAYRDRVLAGRDARERERAAQGLGPASLELRRVRRDRAACARRLEWARREVAHHGTPPARVPAPRPRVEARASDPPALPRPEPRPDPIAAPAQTFGLRPAPAAEEPDPPLNRHERRRLEALERRRRP